MTTLVRYRPDNLSIRPACRDDVPTILGFIRELAEYEKLLNEVVATEDLLRKFLFDEQAAEVVIAEADGEAVGFALFFTSFSTFLGRPGLYLEDLFIKPKARGNGYGKAILAHLSRLVLARGYGRLEWSCLDWNKPSIGFYLSLGAVPQDEWTRFRLTDVPLRDLAGCQSE